MPPDVRATWGQNADERRDVSTETRGFYAFWNKVDRWSYDGKDLIYVRRNHRGLSKLTAHLCHPDGGFDWRAVSRSHCLSSNNGSRNCHATVVLKRS